MQRHRVLPSRKGRFYALIDFRKSKQLRHTQGPFPLPSLHPIHLRTRFHTTLADDASNVEENSLVGNETLVFFRTQGVSFQTFYSFGEFKEPSSTVTTREWEKTPNTCFVMASNFAGRIKLMAREWLLIDWGRTIWDFFNELRHKKPTATGRRSIHAIRRKEVSRLIGPQSWLRGRQSAQRKSSFIDPASIDCMPVVFNHSTSQIKSLKARPESDGEKKAKNN